MSTVRYLRVAVPSPLYKAFDYLPPTGADTAALTPGTRVSVPFGGRDVVGILLDTPAQTGVPKSKLKRAHRILDTTPPIPADMLALARWAAEYYRHPPGEVMQLLMPAALRQGKPARVAGTDIWRITEAGAQADPSLLHHAPRQAALLTVLRDQPDAGCDAVRLDSSQPRWNAAMRALIERGWAEKTRREIEPPAAGDIADSDVALNPAQAAAVGKVTAAGGHYHAFLLDGVTGSGKTEVYLESIAAVLRTGRQALVLVPEIGLTPQLLARFRARFGTVAVFHSGLSDSERLDAWLAARDGRARIVIGTRSAVFVPLQQPGIIVVDEEHDASFKQQDGFRYSARDLAVVRARFSAIPVLLGSATPSLESIHNVRQQRYTRLELPERAGNARHPSLRLLDIRSRWLDEGLSNLLLDAIRRHLDAHGQALLFLNRRGYAPTLMCHACGKVIGCKRCDARMTLHGSQHLQCHHCGAQRGLPANCEQCGAAEFDFFGQGTERIEAALARLFPDAGVVRIDRDSTRRKGAMETLLAGVRDGSHRILIGTQMLAKGHDFPNVTLVGILDADQGLFGVDFRASERMAQLVMQVAGRAGRAERPGEVMIQTHHPAHPLLTHLVREGYASFADAALEDRRMAGLPPFAAMALLRAEAPSAAAPQAFLDAARTLLSAACGRQVEVLGPVPAPMARRAGRYRAQLMLLAARRPPLQTGLAEALPQLQSLQQARRVRWSIDVDPAETY
ncbi:MAG TPA: primosomal protein N' [Gammaproteobacteria bacterium]|nr:primosomal protein N' [Gammaproteobacteria bacterium]